MASSQLDLRASSAIFGTLALPGAGYQQGGRGLRQEITLSMITMVVSKGSESFTVSQLIKFCRLVASKSKLAREEITKIRTLLDFLDYIYGKSRPPAPAPLTHLILLLMKYVKILVNTFPQTPYTNSSSILGQ